ASAWELIFFGDGIEFLDFDNRNQFEDTGYPTAFDRLGSIPYNNNMNERRGAESTSTDYTDFTDFIFQSVPSV
ncbi:MAG TPA: hypothetical protein VKK61_02305, partial [Tepidisphaeraceae bacterium]|nr:hypothetical protein [Tepidisphaeraceae bacterium]